MKKITSSNRFKPPTCSKLRHLAKSTSFSTTSPIHMLYKSYKHRLLNPQHTHIQTRIALYLYSFVLLTITSARLQSLPSCASRLCKLLLAREQMSVVVQVRVIAAAFCLYGFVADFCNYKCCWICSGGADP